MRLWQSHAEQDILWQLKGEDSFHLAICLITLDRLYTAGSVIMD